MKTKFDLYKSASETAATTLDKPALETDGMALSAFLKEKHASEDYPFWRQTFDERREFFLNLKRQAAPSEKPEDQSPKGKQAPIAK